MKLKCNGIVKEGASSHYVLMMIVELRYLNDFFALDSFL